MNNEIVLAAKDDFELRAVEYYISGGTEMNWGGKIVYPDGETIELYPITVISQITTSQEWYCFDSEDDPNYVFALAKYTPESSITVIDAVDIKNRRKMESEEERLALYASAMNSEKETTGRK